jgi:hypothetical protein
MLVMICGDDSDKWEDVFVPKICMFVFNNSVQFRRLYGIEWKDGIEE